MRLKGTIACILISFVLAGCSRLQPIHNVTKAPILTSSSSTLSTDQVRKAIMMGAATKGWTITESKSGKIVATINVRGKHIAKVDILYSNKNYSIKYNDSSNLLHKGNMIHRNYNKWIINLDRAIQTAMLGMTPAS